MYDNKNSAAKLPKIFFENDFDKLGTVLKDTVFGCRKLCVVTDENVENILGEAEKIFVSASVNKFTYVCKPGESSKSVENACKIYKFLIDNKFSRSDFLLSFGGGVVGDLTGFVASTFMRGVEFIHVPTTLMSQVDSSIGGKTAINFAQQKNIIGTFAQPQFIYINPSVLKTLPPQEISNGMAEVIKYSLLDKTLFETLLDSDNIIEKYFRGDDEEKFLSIMRRCIDIKSKIIEQDLYDLSERKVLNLGHTLAHALESESNYKLAHGSAVALGILFALYLSNLADKFVLPKIIHLLKLYNLPTQLKNMDKESILEKMFMDKKCSNAKINFVLLADIGKPILKDNLTKEQIFEAMDYVGESK